MKKIIRKSERVVVYIDGFNLYFGMRDAGFNHFRWLNVEKMVRRLLQSQQKLMAIKYFTSRIGNNPEKQKRQSTYLEALESINVEIHYGHYQENSEKCRRCGHVWQTAKEKMTDVNIGTSMIVDAFNNKYDMALLISGDSDLVPPIKAIHSNFKNKRVFIAFPPSRKNNSMALVAKGSISIGRKTLTDSQFDLVVKSKSGYNLNIPVKWIN